MKIRNDNDVITQAGCEIVIYRMSCYMPHWTLSKIQKQLINDQIVTELPTELSYTKKTVFSKIAEL